MLFLRLELIVYLGKSEKPPFNLKPSDECEFEVTQISLIEGFDSPHDSPQDTNGRVVFSTAIIAADVRLKNLMYPDDTKFFIPVEYFGVSFNLGGKPREGAYSFHSAKNDSMCFSKNKKNLKE